MTAETGSFILSLDTELAWGAVHRGGFAGRESYFDRTRFVVDELLALCETYEVRATWAIVGHLFLEKCSAEDGVKHPDIVRPDYGDFTGDWFDRDPCSNVNEERFWYAPDIVEKIRSCAVPQEIASHNFSHMVIGVPGCGPETFAGELAASKRVARDWGLELKSFVYPRNAIGHTAVLRDHGFTSYRGLAPDWTSRLPGPFRRAARFVDAFLPIAAPIVQPVEDDGIWNLPASYNYLHRAGWGRLVPIEIRVRKAVASLRKAARQGGIFHMWTHPFNIASDTKGLLKGMEKVFQEAAGLRESGLIATVTMSEIVEALEARRRNNKVAAAQLDGAV